MTREELYAKWLGLMDLWATNADNARKQGDDATADRYMGRFIAAREIVNDLENLDG